MYDVKTTLFVTDLDGTLLDSNKRVSKESIQAINSLISEGMRITAATARTPATITGILKGIHMEIPVVCMGGAALYDMERCKFVHTEPLGNGVYSSIMQAAHKSGITPFTHCVEGGSILVYYEDINNDALMRFYGERKDLPLKTYLKKPIDSGIEPIFLMCLDKTDKINDMYREIISRDFSELLHLSKYRDIYEGDHSYLEIYSKNASKASGIELLKKITGAKYVVAFGDSENDAEMLQKADYSYAVENAAEEIKLIADEIIGDNESNSVAQILEKIWRGK